MDYKKIILLIIALIFTNHISGSDCYIEYNSFCKIGVCKTQIINNIIVHNVQEHIDHLYNLVSKLENSIELKRELNDIFKEFHWIIKNKFKLYNFNESSFQKNIYIIFNKLKNKYFKLEDEQTFDNLLKKFQLNLDQLFVKLVLQGNTFLYISLIINPSIYLSLKNQKQILEMFETQGIIL